MRAKRLFLILAGVGAAAAIVAAYRANERRFRALQEEMRALEESRRGEASRPVFVMAAPTTPTAAPREAPAVPERAPAASADESAGPGKGRGITAEEQAAHVGMVFSQEAIDSGWAQQTERSIGGSLRSLTESSTLANLECRKTLCRASLRHPDETKLSDFLDRVSARANELWTGPIYAHRDAVGADGVVQNTIYFAKQGSSIPSPE